MTYMYGNVFISMPSLEHKRCKPIPLPQAFKITSLLFNIFSSKIQVARQVILTPWVTKYTGNPII